MLVQREQTGPFLGPVLHPGAPGCADTGRETMSAVPWITEAAAALAAASGGLGGGLLAMRWARRSLASRASPSNLADAMLAAGRSRKEAILGRALKTARLRYAEEALRLEEERLLAARLQTDYEKELLEKEGELEARELQVEGRIAALAQEQSRAGDEGKALERAYQASVQQEQESKQRLERSAGITSEELREAARAELVEAEQLTLSRLGTERAEDLKTSAKALARGTLGVILDRYSPRFIWPKGSYSFPLPSLQFAQDHFSPDSPLAAALMGELVRDSQERWGDAAELPSLELADSQSGEAPTLRIVSGGGLDRETLRATLEEILERPQVELNKAAATFRHHRKQVERTAAHLGEQAARQLGLSQIHPQILRLIGALNYRTSHRQNQYFHSMEVSCLAGMLASDLGGNVLLARRAGLLHDIGKALDYRIQGSHAVISGDFAARFGEREEVVDTILSHHDDKIVETTEAYILKAADAMSGARPGARVDMEEGYQKRIEGILAAVESFNHQGVLRAAVMHAGREVHVFVDSKKVADRQMEALAQEIAAKLEAEVQFPGQIRITLVRRIEVTEVA